MIRLYRPLGTSVLKNEETNSAFLLFPPATFCNDMLLICQRALIYLSVLEPCEKRFTAILCVHLTALPL